MLTSVNQIKKGKPKQSQVNPPTGPLSLSMGHHYRHSLDQGTLIIVARSAAKRHFCYKGHTGSMRSHRRSGLHHHS